MRISRRVLLFIVWCAIAIALWPFRGRLERELRATNPVANSESAVADSVLKSAFKVQDRETTLLVIGGLDARVDSDAGRAVVRRIIGEIRKLPGVGSIVSPATSLDTMLVGASGKTALALIGLTNEDPSTLATIRTETARILASERQTNSAITLQWTGQPAVLADLRTSGASAAARAELYAIPVTLLVAWWAFGSVINAAIAVFVAALVTVIGSGAMGLLSVFFSPSVMARSIVSLVGLALTVDYLLLMTRAHARDDSAQRRSRNTAFLAAAIVAAGFIGLTVAPTGELRTTAVTGGVVALLAALGAATFGNSRAVAIASQTEARWLAWGRTITRHPIRWAFVSALPLLYLANHARSAILSTPLDNWLPKGSESTQALDLLSRENRIGVAGTAHVVLHFPSGVETLTNDGWASMHKLHATIRRLPHAGDAHSIVSIGTGDLLVAQQVFPASVRDRYVSRDGHSALIEVVPGGESGTPSAIALVDELRALNVEDVTGVRGARVSVSGLPAYSVDYQNATRASLPWVVLTASIATFVALLLALRAPLVAFKAVALNLLVAVSAMGATVFVFQDGLGIALLGREAAGSILPTVPLLGFAATFGISMDYELFLLNAIRAVRASDRPESEAIALGLSHSAGLITRAACVMIAIFAAFAMSDLLPLSMLGFALAVAVLLDATLVRLVLAPALLAIAGRWNWWPGTAVSKSSAHPEGMTET